MNDQADDARGREVGIGKRVKRREDWALLTGRGRFIDDIDLPGEAHAWFVRSPHAHATLRAVDISEAMAMPGVVAVLTGADLASDHLGAMHNAMPLKNRDGSAIHNPLRIAMPADRVRHVGEIVAMVMAESAALARDAADLIAVDYDMHPAIVDARAALDPDAPRVWDGIARNLALDWEWGDRAAVDAAFRQAHRVARVETIINRVSAAALEPRGVVAAYDPGEGRYTIYTPTHGGTPVHTGIAAQGLKVPAADIRLVTPTDVGGGFGAKNFVYPEQILVAWAARRIGRPVKWFADRSDAFLSDYHARDHIQTAELALDSEGRFLALRTGILSNMGAYIGGSGAIIPTSGGTRMLSNVYRIPAIHAQAQCVFTNTVSIAAYRGAGKPEYCYLVERVVDQAARDMDMDPAELRRRNMVRPVDLPYKAATGLVYDSGDFAGNMDAALALADRPGLAARRAAARARGRLLGFGFSTYTEPDGYKDGRVGLQFDPTGSLTLTNTACTHGQGHATVFSQIAADLLGLPLEGIRVVQGDTDRVGHGTGAGGSRVTTIAGTAIHQASRILIEKGRHIAANMMEASAADVDFADGHFRVAGTDRSVDIIQVAKASFNDAAVPAGMDLGFEAAAHFSAKAYSYPNGCHVCEVEIDAETGEVEVTRYALVSDFGTVVNPMLLEGQLHGGIAQGIGQILWEDIRYADSGQLLTGSFMDYCLPRATHLPNFDWGVNETRCTTNPLGVKGCGESGPTAAMPAVMNAVLDALSDYDTQGLEMPVTAEKAWRVVAKGPRRTT